ncbi:hypothetical protein LTR94_038506, partial [Friedmanniomyces endolithicus]
RGWFRRNSSARFSRSSPTNMWTKRWPRPTPATSGWAAPSGVRTRTGPWPWPAASRPAPSG